MSGIEPSGTPGSLNPDDPASAERFISANTRVLSPPLVPEIRLHLAEESLPIWQRTEEELGEMNVPPPFWAFAWAGGQALARYLLDNPGLIVGKTVIDLGTGSGVLAMAAALSGARRVTGIDIDRDAIASAESSARLNTLPDTIEFLVGDFRAEPPPPADLVMANLTGGMLASSAAAIAALVRPAGHLIVSGFDYTEVEAVLTEVADGVAGQFQRSLDFFLASASDATISRIYLPGGSAKVPALQKALQEKARTSVEILNPFNKVIIDERKFDMEFLRAHAPEATVATGLALRRMGDKT